MPSELLGSDKHTPAWNKSFEMRDAVAVFDWVQVSASVDGVGVAEALAGSFVCGADWLVEQPERLNTRIAAAASALIFIISPCLMRIRNQILAGGGYVKEDPAWAPRAYVR